MSTHAGKPSTQARRHVASRAIIPAPLPDGHVRPHDGGSPWHAEPEPEPSRPPRKLASGVAIYVRRSTDEEHQPFSIEAQDSRRRAYVKSQPCWSLVARFEDDDSGAKLDRPGLEKALAAARAGRFDVLLVYRVDRFTRRIRDLVTLLDELDRAGVMFRSATEPFDTSTRPRMLVQMLGVFAEFERETIIDRVINGMERKASKGKWTLGQVPYGFTLNPPSTPLSPSKTKSRSSSRSSTCTPGGGSAAAPLPPTSTNAVLRRCAHRSAAKQPRTQAWSHKTVSDVTVSDVLTNRVYLGEVHFREVIAVGADDAVIDPATFDLAQEILAQRGETPAKKATASSDYHLTGKISCPACARRYIGTNAYGRSRTYRYYTEGGSRTSTIGGPPGDRTPNRWIKSPLQTVLFAHSS